MKQAQFRTWFLVHKWASIVCTAFLLMLCLTGLPLIFHDEIDRLTGNDPMAGMVGAPSSQGGLPLDTVLETALAARPGEVPLFMAFDNETPVITVTTGPAPDAAAKDMTIQLFNRTTGAPAGQVEEGGVMHFILTLHVDMFMGLPGMLFLGLMGMLFMAAIVSGVVLYAPFMRRLPFGAIRASRSARVKWLDYHNMVGAVTLAWASVVGFTGVVNTWSDPIIGAWQRLELRDMTAAYQGLDPVPPERYGSLDAAMAAARATRPDRNPQFIAFPGGAYSSAHHYAVFFQGGTPVTEYVLTPALIDAQTGELTDVRTMPWYAAALSLSKPLHFGDYGGLPLKILWSVLDILTIVVLGSGLYLWLGKSSRSARARGIEQEVYGAAAPGSVPAE